MILFPRAKINIGLRITGRRSDGYHDIQTIFYPVGLSDAIEFIVPAGRLSSDKLTTSGIKVDCPPEKNLVISALERMRREKDIPWLRIHLHKSIPSGAGLGGGSSDAASLISGLNRYFKFGYTTDQLKEFALSIGSDCPFFIDCVPVYAEGRGEKMTPLSRTEPGKWILIIKPPFDISTREAYRNCRPGIHEGSDLPELFNMDIPAWKESVSNDFEKTVFPEYPSLAAIKDELYRSGALYSSMSGSGSAVYGIFDKKPVVPPGIMNDLVYSGAF